MNTHRSTALLWAILYLRDHGYSANAMILLSFVDSHLDYWSKAFVGGMTEALAMDCGISAARECACKPTSQVITDGAWIEPEDLRE